MKKDDFKLKDLPLEAQDKEISSSDFKFVDSKRSHEQKFQTKPTTFFKDSIKRFAKNKSSVVAAGILGFLLLSSFIIPIVDRNDITTAHPEFRYLEPKLFDGGTGFWDGTKKWSDIPVQISNNDIDGTDKENNWAPDPSRYPNKKAIINPVYTPVRYTSIQSEYGKEGYIQFGYLADEKNDSVKFSTPVIDEKKNGKFDLTAENKIVAFDTFNEDKLALVESENTIPESYTLQDIQLVFEFTDIFNKEREIVLIDTSANGVHSIGSTISSLKENEVNITPIINEFLTTNSIVSADPNLSSVRDARISAKMNNLRDGNKHCALIRSIGFATNSTNSNFKTYFEAPSFGLYYDSVNNPLTIESATQCVIQKQKNKVISGTTISEVKNPSFWTSNGVKLLHMSKLALCSFTYDSYEAVFGIRYNSRFDRKDLDTYYTNGWIDYNYDTIYQGGRYVIDESNTYFEILDPVNCPITEELSPQDFIVDQSDGDVYFVRANVCYYKYYGYKAMPKFLFGTDVSGKDMLKVVAEGLRTSLLLGILTTAVCFIFGLLWGSVSGYFGGTVDLIMERITDILSGVPWIVVMTLVIIKLGTDFWTFALALCLTGWIGTAATTRTQFYRFRGREYVLASRTLGASDARLIAKHILPNAMGTIITSAVLMVPSVIFSEATISYLGLGLKGLSSLGVTLSDNQIQLEINPYLLIFPSIIIALLMISFNLFGNGLRDAVNPSLKGEGE